MYYWFPEPQRYLLNIDYTVYGAHVSMNRSATQALLLSTKPDCSQMISQPHRYITCTGFYYCDEDIHYLVDRGSSDGKSESQWLQSLSLETWSSLLVPQPQALNQPWGHGTTHYKGHRNGCTCPGIGRIILVQVYVSHYKYAEVHMSFKQYKHLYLYFVIIHCTIKLQNVAMQRCLLKHGCIVPIIFT